LTDWLADEVKAGPYFVSVKEGQRLLASFCLRDYQEKALHWSPYTLRHLFTYLIHGGNWHNLNHLIRDTLFIEAVVKLDGLQRFLDRLYLSLSDYVRNEHRIQVYVSSTFSDMVEERSALHMRVFPALQELATKYACTFEPIDMAWAVSEQASMDQRTTLLCLEALERCQRTSRGLKFILLLGDRYGWCPLPSRIEVDELSGLIAFLPESAKKWLEKWYRCDCNAIPPAYVLQSHTEDWGAWSTAEAQLHLILRQAVKSIGWTPNDPRRYKYETSAVSAEVRVIFGMPSEDCRHVYAFFRNIADLPHDRRAAPYVDWDAEARERLKELKAEILMRMPENIYTYTTSWTGTGPSTEYLQLLCDDVYRRLSQVIVAEAREHMLYGNLDVEFEANEAFANDRNRIFVGRQDVLYAILAYVIGGSDRPLVLHGPAGSGKSAVMARASQDARLQIPSAEVIRRFIGATGASTESRLLLNSICEEISRRFGLDCSRIPQEYGALARELSKLLTLATSDRPLLLFIDGVNELDVAQSDRLSLDLPLSLPPHAKVILSATTEKNPYATVTPSLPPENVIELGRLSHADCELLLEERLRLQSRTLMPVQRSQTLAACSSSGMPQYVTLAIREALAWRSFDDVGKLHLEYAGMLELVWERLEQEHGRVLVSKAMGYLSASRLGLSESELLEVLSRDTDVVEECHPKISAAVKGAASALISSLRPYLTERRVHGADLICFSHKSVQEAAAKRYLTAGECPVFRCQLGLYFHSRAFARGEASVDDKAPQMFAL
jgi:hypothetical protein